jgi:hypothetical protein
VESIFSKGKFIQNLEGAINDIAAGTPTSSPTPAAISSDLQSSAETARLNRQAGNTTTASGAPVSTTGLIPDPAVGTSTQPSNLSTGPDQSAAETARLARLGATQQTAPTNNPATPQVQNDDASLSAGATQAGAAQVSSTNSSIPTITSDAGAGRENTVTTAEQAIALGA